MQQGHSSNKGIIRFRPNRKIRIEDGSNTGSTPACRRGRSSIASASGFTLAELLIATSILSFALTQILILFMNCMASNEASRNLSTAVTHAEYVLEDVRNTDFSNVAASIANGSFNYADAAAVTAAGLQALKSETITAQSSGTNPLNVTVTVSWQDHGGRSRTRSLQTIIGG